MSQYSIDVEVNNDKFTVLVGYDNPLHRYYLVVERFIASDEDEIDDENFYLYTNLSDNKLVSEPHNYRDLGYFKNALKNLNIKIPELIWENVQRDKYLDD